MKIAGVVPAAGRSLRMGRAKALLDAGGGLTFVERVATTLARGGCGPVFVVLRDPAAPEGVLARRVGARVIENAHPEEGPVTSVRCALRALPAGVGGIAVLPVDHPLVEPTTLEEMIAAFDADLGAAALVPTHGGRRGHPVLMRSTLFAEIMEDDLPEGLRTVLRRDPTRVRELAVDDAGVLADLDTPDALRRHLPGALPASLRNVQR